MKPKGWDATPTPRRNREDAPSARVPNVAWDSTPRGQSQVPSTPRSRDGGAGGNGWGGAKDRRWDAPTPRTVRGGGGDDDDIDDGASVVGGREWEEEQVKLDRDWYMGSEGGLVSLDASLRARKCGMGIGEAKQFAFL